MSQLNHGIVGGEYAVLEGASLPLANCADSGSVSSSNMIVTELERTPESFPQTGTNRCWAAALQTAGAFLNVPISQDELVARAERSRLVKRSTCGSDPDAIELLELMALDNVVPKESQDRALLLDVLHLTDGATPLVDALKAGTPVIFVLRPTGGEGHAYLAYRATTVSGAPGRDLISVRAIDPRLPAMWPSVELPCRVISRDLMAAMSVRVGTKAEAASRRHAIELRGQLNRQILQ